MGVFVGYFKDPVFQVAGQWFFWDRTWRTEVGPFETEQMARAAMDAYVRDCVKQLYSAK